MRFLKDIALTLGVIVLAGVVLSSSLVIVKKIIERIESTSEPIKTYSHCEDNIKMYNDKNKEQYKKYWSDTTNCLAINSVGQIIRIY